jgi:hypothetical protein
LMSSFGIPLASGRRSIHTTASRPTASTDSTGPGPRTARPVTGLTFPLSTSSRYGGSADTSSCKPVAAVSGSPWSWRGRVAAAATVDDGALRDDWCWLGPPCPAFEPPPQPTATSTGTSARRRRTMTIPAITPPRRGQFQPAVSHPGPPQVGSATRAGSARASRPVGGLPWVVDNSDQRRPALGQPTGLAERRIGEAVLRRGQRVRVAGRGPRSASSIGAASSTLFRGR